MHYHQRKHKNKRTYYDKKKTEEENCGIYVHLTFQKNSGKLSAKAFYGSVFNFVSMTSFLIPEVGCGQSPRIPINAGFLKYSMSENPSKRKVQRHKIIYTLLFITTIMISLPAAHVSACPFPKFFGHSITYAQNL